MNDPASDERLQQLDRRHEELLAEIDAFNLQLEATLAQISQSPSRDAGASS